jgi:DNA invertase Pin-like site-specific DNA recombinase
MLLPKQVDRLIQLRQRGFGYRPIAKDIGCSVSTVQRWCRKLDLVKKPKSEYYQKIKHDEFWRWYGQPEILELPSND